MIALGFGLVFTVIMLVGGRWIYALMGGQGGALEAALVYSNGVFAGAALIWFFNALSALTDKNSLKPMTVWRAPYCQWPACAPPHRGTTGCCVSA